MDRAISQGLDWAVSNIWLTSPFVSNFQPIPLVENQFLHEALDEGALGILRKPSLHTKRVQLLQQGISPPSRLMLIGLDRETSPQTRLAGKFPFSLGFNPGSQSAHEDGLWRKFLTRWCSQAYRFCYPAAFRASLSLYMMP